jgi:hypothetical protein
MFVPQLCIYLQNLSQSLKGGGSDAFVDFYECMKNLSQSLKGGSSDVFVDFYECMMSTARKTL